MAVSEKEFTAQVLQLAKLRGWRTIHLRPARTAHGWRTAVQGDGVGFPDIFAVRGSRILAAELKVGKRLLTTEQAQWLESFRRAGVETYAWWPSDWDVIERTLE